MIKKQRIKFIDLDLPSGILWASRDFENGKYYTWEELQGYTRDKIRSGLKSFGWDNYKFRNYGFKKSLFVTKYNKTDKLTELQPGDDIVTQILGDNFRIPRKEDFEELINHTHKIYDNNFVIFKSNVNGNQIKFYLDRSTKNYAYCYCWSSSLCDYLDLDSWVIYIGSDSCRITGCNRCKGFLLRPVKLK